MSLPPTYYDFIRNIRPFLIELAEQDAKDLLSDPTPPSTIYTVDSYQSRFSECLGIVESSLLNHVAQLTGMSLEQIKAHTSELPNDVKVMLAGIRETVNQEYHVAVNFALSGKKTFYFSDNLAEHLANTEINLKTGLVELPFPTCLFVFTSPTIINAMHNTRGAEGRRQINTTGLDYSAPVSVFLTMHPADNDLPGRKLLMVALHARQPSNSYLCLKRELYMDENWTLEQALHTDWEKISHKNAEQGISLNTVEGTTSEADDKKFYADGLLFFRIILNSVLYLSSDQPELLSVKSPRPELEARAASIVSVPKRKKARQSARQHSILDYQEVGASIGTIVIQYDQDQSDIHKSGVGSKPLVRFMVRGHWRLQPFGHGLSERKLIRIQPYYKGSDVAAHINKPYLVK